MGLLTPVLDFLFGKDPDIFDENGNVLHKHPKKKWDAWQNRLKLDNSYNWRHHMGTQAGQKKPAGNATPNQPAAADKNRSGSNS